MSRLMNAIMGAVGRGADGQQSTDQNIGQPGLDSNAALQYTQDKWSDRRNAYIVYH